MAIDKGLNRSGRHIDPPFAHTTQATRPAPSQTIATARVGGCAAVLEKFIKALPIHLFRLQMFARERNKLRVSHYSQDALVNGDGSKW